MLASIETLRFKKLDSRAVLPKRGSVLAAGLDVCGIEDVEISPKQRAMARTGLAVAIPPGFYGRVAPRSGLAAKSGLDVLSGGIDSDYRGEVICLLYNTGDETINLPAGSKICQLIIEQIITPEATWGPVFEKPRRGPGGFG